MSVCWVSSEVTRLKRHTIAISSCPFMCVFSRNQTSTMASNTTFILVPGAWHPASALEPIMGPLRAAGHNVTGIDLACYGAEPPLNDFKPDVSLVRNAIEEAADNGQDVVVFMHSYGGVVGTEACRGLGKEERKASGKKGGVVRLIYCTAFLLDEGKPAWASH